MTGISAGTGRHNDLSLEAAPPYMVHMTGAVPEDHPDAEAFTAAVSDRATEPAVMEVGGYRIISDGTIVQEDEVLAIVDGYLADHAPEDLPGLYAEHGTDLFSMVDGRNRILIVDADRGRLLAATDRGADRPTYRADRVIASHPALLLEAGIVAPELDRDRVRQYLLAPQAMRSGGPTLIRGVEKLRGSSYVIADQPGQHRYWDWYRQETVDLSDEQAVDHLDAAMAEAAADLTQDIDELRVLFTGGLDSSLLTWYLQEHGSADLRPTMLRFPDDDPDVGTAEQVAGSFGLGLDTVDRATGLPGADAVWDTGEPINFSLHFDFARVRDRFPDATFAGGDKAIFPFPTGHGSLRTLEAAQPFRQPVQAVARPLVRRGVQRLAGRRARKAIDILAGRPAAPLTNSKNLASSEKRDLVEHDDDLERPEAAMDRVWGLDHGPGLAYNYHYLEYRQMEGTDVPLFLRGMRYRDVFMHPAVRDTALRLPLRQRQDRRLMDRLAQGAVPDRVRQQGPSAHSPLRRALADRIEADRELYRRRIRRFMDRGFLHDAAQGLLERPDGFSELAYGAAVYMLETWIEGLDRWR